MERVFTGVNVDLCDQLSCRLPDGNGVDVDAGCAHFRIGCSGFEWCGGFDWNCCDGHCFVSLAFHGCGCGGFGC